MLTLKQVEQCKLHAKEAVESLPEDHPWIHFLGSLDMLCDTALELYTSQPDVEVGRATFAVGCTFKELWCPARCEDCGFYKPPAP